MKLFPILLTGLVALELPAQNRPALPAPNSPIGPVPTEPAAVPAPPPKGVVTIRPPGKTKRLELTAPDANRLVQQTWEFDAALPRTTKTGRTLVVQSSEIAPSALADAELDMSVMALILRKATGARTDDRRMALGIEVDANVFGSTSGARNIYLEGYGALFLLGVRFPLLAPTEATDEKEPKEDTSNEWVEARDEFLNGGEQPRFGVGLDTLTRLANRQPVEDYDADKVEELKSGLLQALKNASHIRALKASDYVTVVIQGGDTLRPAERTAGKAGSRNRSENRPSETVMTMRVHKPDIDAFAKGTLALEGFRKKASIHTYSRRGDSSVGTAGFISPQKQ
jgi:hypothetical protein